jgi:hypothetical protein
MWKMDLNKKMLINLIINKIIIVNKNKFKLIKSNRIINRILKVKIK